MAFHENLLLYRDSSPKNESSVTLYNRVPLVKGAVCTIVAKTGTANTFKLLLRGVSPPPPPDSRLPDRLQDPTFFLPTHLW